MKSEIEPLISLKSVFLTLNNISILNDINITIMPNTITTLIGPNGGGKSSILKVLLKLIPATSGQIYHKKNLSIGYVPQKLFIDPTLPINVIDFLKLKPKVSHQAIIDTLTIFEIEHLKYQMLSSLSGGQMQRVLLTRALLNKPDVLVLDEPMQGVDINGQARLYQLLNDIRNKNNCAIVMVSHDLNLVMAHTDEVFCVNKHVCCSGVPAQVRLDPAFEEFFGSAIAQSLTFYQHNHNHKHHISGDLCDKNCKSSH